MMGADKSMNILSNSSILHQQYWFSYHADVQNLLSSVYIPNVYSRHYVAYCLIRRFWLIHIQHSTKFVSLELVWLYRQNMSTVHFTNRPACPPGKRSWSTLSWLIHPVVFDMSEFGINIFFSKFDKLVNALQIKRT